MSKAKPTIAPRKPPAAAPVNPAAAAQFVASGGSASASARKPPDIQTSGHSDSGRRSSTTLTRTRGGERVVKRMTIYLPADLAKRLAVRCAEQDRQISDTIADAVEGWLTAH